MTMRAVACVLAVSAAVLSVGCTISGRVATDAGGLEGAAVSLSGPSDRTTTTAADGRYAFRWLLTTGTHTVKPSMAGYEMTPQSRQAYVDGYFDHVAGVDFSAKQLAPVEAPVLGNATATDIQNDGVFDSINTASPVEVRSTRVTYLSSYYTRRALFALDLAGVSRTVPIRSAVFEFTVNGLGHGGGGIELDFWGYKGDSVIDLADAGAGDAIVATLTVSTLGRKQVELKDFIQNVVDAGGQVAGLNIRARSESATSNVDEHCNIAGRQSTSAIAAPPRLTIAY